MAELLLEEAQQVHLEVVPRGKINVPALGGEDPVARAVPDEDGLPEARAGGDQDLVPLPCPARLERHQRAGRQNEDAVSGGLEVVQEPDPRRTDGPGETPLLHLPGKIRGDAAPVHDGPRHAEAGGRDSDGGTLAEKPADHGLKALELAAGEHGFPDQARAAGARLEEGERRFGPADIPREQQALPGASRHGHP